MGIVNEVIGAIVAEEALDKVDPNGNLLEKGAARVGGFVGENAIQNELGSLFEKKTDLLQLLDMSSRAQGVQIYIGGDSQLIPVEDVSIITAPYGVDGKVVGTLGVIGPTRMAYERVIPIVDITARLLSNALSNSNT